MDVSLQKGYPDYVGKRFIWAGNSTGPSSYTTGGVPLNLPRFGNYIDSVNGGVLSVSGTYFVRPVPLVAGPRATWKLKWFVTATNAEVGAGTNLSGESVQLSGFGGVY